MRDLASPAEFLRGDRLLRADRVLSGVTRRRPSQGRDLPPLAPAIQRPGVRHAHRAVPHALPRPPLRRDVRAAQGTRRDRRVDDRSPDRPSLPPGQRREHHPARHGRPSGSSTTCNCAALSSRPCGAIGRSLRIVLVDLPGTPAQSSPVATVDRECGVKAAWRFLIKPGLATAPVWAAGQAPGYTPMTANAVGLFDVPGRVLRVQHPRRADGRGDRLRAGLVCLAPGLSST